MGNWLASREKYMVETLIKIAIGIVVFFGLVFTYYMWVYWDIDHLGDI